MMFGDYVEGLIFVIALDVCWISLSILILWREGKKKVKK